MLTEINPKLPMKDLAETKDYYINKLGFHILGEFDNYLIVSKDQVQIHFFTHKDLDPKVNYSQVYIRTNAIDKLYQMFLDNGISIHSNGPLETKAWGQREFALLDPCNNLLTFGQHLN